MDTEDEFTGPVNLGSTDEITVNEMAELILELTGSASKISYRPLPQDDPMQRKPDISMAKKELGWEPGYDLKKGLEKTIDYFRERI
ncbi:MAG TPA: hypothetical protein VJ877_06010, partial [Bacteroidales bacterium]|nr:hypothetical protein [Bacteroidales bacterium]